MTSFQKYLLIILVLSLAVWFYWFQYEPSQIRAECVNEAIKKASNNHVSELEEEYDICIVQFPTLCNIEKEKLENAKLKKTYSVVDYESYFNRCKNSRGLK